ncbi:MAG: YcgN family cysteine cluster protein [Neomegalonema sp.]|nr:YcgN family cysteine cluster protein [Neomegalonema sp.]
MTSKPNKRRGRGAQLEPEFWRKKTLEQLSHEEWEALCDGCGKCCLLKLEDCDTNKVSYTNVACRLFDPETCRCGSYDLRFQLVPQCVQLTPETVRREKEWMPRTCAYRLVAEGYDLYPWHPLRTGDANSVHEAGVSILNQCELEFDVPEDELEDHIVAETI